MFRTRTPRTAILGLVLLALAACGDSNDEIAVLEPPLGIQNTYPADLPSTYTGSADLAVNFTRATGVYEMQVSIFPTTPTGPFDPNTETRTNWTWHDVRFEASAGCYFWLVDGIRLGRYVFGPNDVRVFRREPIVVRIPTSGDRQANVGFAGQVESPVLSVIASGSIVFVLPSASTTFNPLDPASFDPTEAVAVCVADRGDDFVELPAQFRATMLPVDTAYVVVGIKDTNRDLYYNPVDDWWGYFEDQGGPANVISKEDTGEKDSEFNGAVSLVLRAPVPATTD